MSMMDDLGIGAGSPELFNDITQYPGGAKRSRLKPPFHMISLDLLKRVAEVWRSGAAKYGPGNWQKGGEEFIGDIPNHIIEHIWFYLIGDTSEDHLAHIICNCQMLIDFRASFSGGKLMTFDKIKGTSEAS